MLNLKVIFNIVKYQWGKETETIMLIGLILTSCIWNNETLKNMKEKK